MELSLDTTNAYSRIQVWLDELADDHTENSSDRKTAPKRKRKTLGERSTNIVIDMPFPSTPSSRENDVNTKKRRRSSSMERDVDRTPRQIAPSSTIPVVLSLRDAPIAPSLCSSSSRSSSNRASSPSKRIGLGDLRLLPTEIRLVSFDNRDFPLPVKGEALLKSMRKINLEKRVVPASLQPTLSTLIENFELAQSHFYSASENLTGRPHSPFTDSEFLSRIKEILQAAGTCETDCDSEAGWNEEVHSRMLNLVLRGWSRPIHLTYKNVTSARISNASASKIVDYAIVIVPDHETEKRITTKLKSRLEQSINHTKAECVRYKPIAISIETKRPGMDEDGAKVQLGTWAAAQIARLHQLCDRNSVDIPPLPQILVQGHDWRLKLASVNEYSTIILHGDLPIGDTRSLLGIFTLSRQLERLFEWVGKEYSPWFTQNCV